MSYFLVLVIIGIPVWWYTTRVYRATLPINEMSDVFVPSRTIRENKIPLSLEYDVLITIVHPEPQRLKVDSDTNQLLSHMQPFKNAMEPITNLTFKSQWLYFVELDARKKEVNGHYALFENQLPHVITPLEKKIWSHMSSKPTLNLVLYVSHCHIPLFIYDDNNLKVETQAFLSSPWGGIHILNPDKASCDKNVYQVDVKNVAKVFKAQLMRLIGLKSSAKADIDELKRVKALEMVESTRRTLKSLAQLLSEISSIVISDEVASKVQTALLNADKADAFMQQNHIDEALKCAQVAFENSELAFSDPSLLALLYFPDDQKYLFL